VLNPALKPEELDLAARLEKESHENPGG
jgi:hypothetical protein